MRYKCKYCGKERASKGAKATHEASCPLMRRFADMCIQSAELSETAFPEMMTILIHLRTTNGDIIEMIRRSAE